LGPPATPRIEAQPIGMPGEGEPDRPVGVASCKKNSQPAATRNPLRAALASREETTVYRACVRFVKRFDLFRSL